MEDPLIYSCSDGLQERRRKNGIKKKNRKSIEHELDGDKCSLINAGICTSSAGRARARDSLGRCALSGWQAVCLWALNGM